MSPCCGAPSPGPARGPGLPVDRIDDAVLILEALLGDARTARAEEVHLVLTARPGSFALLMGPLAGSEAERLLAPGRAADGRARHRAPGDDRETVDDGSHLLIVVDA